MNIAFAVPNAAGPEDIAAIDRKISLKNGLLVKNGPAKFGAAGHLSYILLEVMKVDPKMRCVISITPATDTLDLIEEIGLNAIDSGRRGKPEWSIVTRNIIEKNRGVPDAISDVDNKNGRTVKILGTDPSDVLSKLSSILD